MAIIKKVSLQEQAYDYIRNCILNGEFEQETIYSEKELTDRLGVSRTPIREALMQLRNEGLIDTVPSRGFMIKRMNDDTVRETYEVRASIECYCAVLLARKCDTLEGVECLKSLDRTIKMQQELFKNPSETSFDLFVQLSLDFHTTIVSFSKNQYLINSLEAQFARVRSLAYYTLNVAGRMDNEIKEHTEVMEAIASGDEQKAYACMLKHIDIAYKTRVS